MPLAIFHLKPDTNTDGELGATARPVTDAWPWSGSETGARGRVLYHLTTRDALASILERGLVPARGVRCERVQHVLDEPAVFACGSVDAALALASTWLWARTCPGGNWLLRFETDAPAVRDDRCASSALGGGKYLRIHDAVPPDRVAVVCYVVVDPPVGALVSQLGRVRCLPGPP